MLILIYTQTNFSL